MTDFSPLIQQINSAFPRVEAPEEFRAYCQKMISETPDPQAYGLGDYVHMALAYRGLPWWELAEKYTSDGTLAFRIEELAPLLDMDVWRYYVPIFLLQCIESQKRDPVGHASGNAEFLQSQFGRTYRQAEFARFTLSQKQCIAQTIALIAANVAAQDAHIISECLAYWSQFL